MSNLSALASNAVIYQELGDHIHSIRFEESSRQSASGLFKILEHLYVSEADKGFICLLVDSVQESVPITPTVRDGIALEKRFPTHVPVYVALLHQHPLGSIVDVLLRPLRSKNQVRMFGPEKREDAIAWLKMKQAEVHAVPV